MVNGNRDCSEVLQQIAAVKSAIDGLSKEVAVSGICRFVPKGQTKEVEKMVERAINL